MKPGDLVRSRCYLDFYSDKNLDALESGVRKNTIGTILSSPKNFWVKLLVEDKVGWVNSAHLELIQ
jgi:hypothetical protein